MKTTVYTKGGLYEEYNGLCSYYRDGFYYLSTTKTGKPCEKVFCKVGYYIGDNGLPYEAKLFIKEQITGKGTHIFAETVDLFETYKEFTFENPFEYFLLCENCISYLESCGDKVITLCEIDTQWDCKTAHCSWCDEEDETTENKTGEVLYLCHY